jgi:hypothetical protein
MIFNARICEMATFTGTVNADVIAPGGVSAGVTTSNPLQPWPSEVDDVLFGMEGGDHLDGGDGNDQLNAGTADGSS